VAWKKPAATTTMDIRSQTKVIAAAAVFLKEKL